MNDENDADDDDADDDDDDDAEDDADDNSNEFWGGNTVLQNYISFVVVVVVLDSISFLWVKIHKSFQRKLQLSK